jgi:hypothetical protein
VGAREFFRTGIVVGTVRAFFVTGNGFDGEEVSGAKWPESTHIYFQFCLSSDTSDYEIQHQKQ